MRTVCSSEFQTDGVQDRNARLEKFPTFVRRNCQLVCDLLLDWQPMQLALALDRLDVWSTIRAALFCRPTRCNLWIVPVGAP